MSDLVRVGLVIEGVTDYVLIRAIIGKLLGGREFVTNVLQPEFSEAFVAQGSRGSGWAGVHRWCRQSSEQGGGGEGRYGKSRESFAFVTNDVVVVHLDADVASKKYSDENIAYPKNDLPCVEPCPPARGSTDALRGVCLGWLGEDERPLRLVFCTPSKSSGAWVMAAFFPRNKVMREQGFECYPDPDSQLAVQKKDRRVKKNRSDYERIAADFAEKWPEVRRAMTEAERFAAEFSACIGAVDRARG